MENLIFYETEESEETERKSNRVQSFKRLLRMMAVLMMALATFIACEKGDSDNDGNDIVNEKPGQISGFGNNTGKIGGKAFELPDGIVFDGDFSGINWESLSQANPMSAVYAKPEKKSARVDLPVDEVMARSIAGMMNFKYDLYGSGLNVMIIIQLKNTASRQIDVEFPAGLIFECSNSRYQHGILIKKTVVSVPANDSYRFVLQMYCCNEKRSIPDTSTKFLKPVITNSKLLLELCELVKNKRINVEENMETMEQWGEYMAMATQLQEIVWKLTDYGQSLDKSDMDYIARLPPSK